MVSKYRNLQLKIFHFIYDYFYLLKCWFLILYSRLFRIIKTCYMIEIVFSFYNRFFCWQKVEWKTHWQSPICHDILKRKYRMNRLKSSLSWAICSLVIASFIFIDIKCSFFTSFFCTYSMTVWYSEIIICALLFLNGMIALYLYTETLKPIAISPVQKKLFRIENNDAGFEVKQKEESLSKVKSEPLQFSSFRESVDYSSPSLLSATPVNYSINSWISSSPSSVNLDTTSSSWSFRRASSPLSYSTPKSNHSERISFRKLDYTADLDSSYDRPIKNLKHLEEFLKAHEEEKQRSSSNDNSKHFLTSMTVENSPMTALSKCLYQRAYRLPNAESTEDNSSEIICGENVMNKLKVTDRMLNVWCECIRKWICQTILVKVVQEIDDINTTLIEIGLPEFQIGNVSLLALNQLAITKGQNLPTLTAVLPYLDMHLNQEYLVKRLKTLAQGGCMSNFKWNAGGTYNDKLWCEDLPTDSALVMHVLCCYFDAHLPPEPHFPEGKPFSSKYLKKIPEKPILSKDLFYVYQSCMNPPHFKVILHEDIYSIQRGRNNLFCSLVIFLHFIKSKECGMLGRVNLGKSGLNILWVLE